MRESTRRLLEKGDRAIASAARLLDAGDAEFAVGRAYYAMFYAAEALLDHHEFHFRKHAGVHSAIGEHFVKTGRLDMRFHRWLIAAFNKRIIGDYGVEADITPDEVRVMVAQAKEFLLEARRIVSETENA
ncbi:MAG: HEPN domain-containing protein [Planctomycetota bacterium]